MSLNFLLRAKERYPEVFDICMIYGNAYANASAMVFYGRSNAFLIAVDSEYSELWISLLQWK